jgi:cytochrome c biogenesis protein CcdA
VLFIVIALFFAGYGGGQIYSYLNNKDNTYAFHPGIWFAIPIAVVYLGVGALIAFTTKVSNPKEAVIFAIYFIVLYASTWILMNILKFCWARPRWRHLYAEYGAGAADYFKPWYHLELQWSLFRHYGFLPLWPHDERPVLDRFSRGQFLPRPAQRQGVDHPPFRLSLGRPRRSLPHHHGRPFPERHHRGVRGRAFAL